MVLGKKLNFKLSLILLIALGIFLFYYRFFPFGPVISGKTLIFIFWTVFLLLFRISGKVSVILGLLLLLVIAFFLATNHQGVALRISIYSYGFLLIGALLQFVVLLKTKK